MKNEPKITPKTKEPLPDYKEEQESIGQEKYAVRLEDLESNILPGIAGHNWRQQGPHLVCTSCKVRHAVYIGLTKRVIQIKSNGDVILESV